jgi:hypothetical protein
LERRSQCLPGINSLLTFADFGFIFVFGGHILNLLVPFESFVHFSDRCFGVFGHEKDIPHFVVD